MEELMKDVQKRGALCLALFGLLLAALVTGGMLSDGGTPLSARAEDAYVVRFLSDADSDSLTLMPVPALGREGEEIDDPNPSGVPLMTSIGGKNFLLVGWTTAQAGQHVWEGNVPKDDDPIARYFAEYGGEFYYYDGGDRYTVRWEDADENGVITLYAVWAADENRNGVPDFDEEYRYTLTFNFIIDGQTTSVPKKISPVKNIPEGTSVLLPGKGEHGYTYSLARERDGRTEHYLLVGWTTVADLFLFSGAPDGFDGHSYFPVGSEYRVDEYGLANSSASERTVKFYAVWAADNDGEEGRGDGIPDYLREYQIVYSSDLGGELSPADLPYTLYGQRGGTQIATRMGYTLKTGGKRYTLLGWSAKPLENYLSEDGRLPEEGAVAAGEPFTVDACYAQQRGEEMLITLHAVWCADENGNQTPDFDEPQRTVRYRNLMQGTVEGWQPDAGGKFERIDGNILDPAAYSLRGGGKGRYETSLLLRGEKYLLAGWTEDASLSDYFLGGADAPSVKFRNFYEVGAPLSETGDCTVVTLFAVWAEDREGGTGNGVPDYRESYTVSFSQGREGTLLPGELPHPAEARRCGTYITLPYGYFLGSEGKNYALLGWSAEGGAAEPSLPPRGEYAVRAEDADEEGKIVLQAHWTPDANANGVPDGEENFIYRLEAGVAGEATDGLHPLPYDLGGRGKSRGAGELLPSGYTLALASGERYLLLGWTRNAPPSPLCNSTEERNALSGTFFDTYFLDPADADREGVICFYAVWGRDDNTDGAEDYEQLFEVVYDEGSDGYLTPSFPASEKRRVGEILILPAGRQLVAEDGERRYTLVGWTLCPGRYLLDDPKGYIETAGGILVLEAGREYTLLARDADKSGQIVFYAVWAIEREPSYTVVFSPSLPDGCRCELVGPRFPSAICGLKEADLMRVNAGEGYRLNAFGTRYLFAGWTYEREGEHFYNATDGEKFGSAFGELFPAGRSAQLDGSRADKYGVITLYAVWVEDANGEGTPDWLEERYRVSFFPGAGDFRFEDMQGLLAGATVRLPVLFDGSYLYSAVWEGKRCLLVGWTEQRVCDLGAGLPVRTGEYPVTEDVVFYGVWAADVENGGHGDGVPDLSQRYTVRFGNALSDAESVCVYRGLCTGEAVSAPSFLFEGESGLLLGWTTTPENSNVPSRFLLPGESYTVRAEDAEEEGMVRFYAVWAEDGNRNGIPDREEKFTVRFANEAAGRLSPADLPASVTVEGAALFEEGKVALATGYALDTERAHYVLLGWTLLSGETLHEGPFSVPLVQEYAVRAEDADEEGVITLYALWGIDENHNGIVDWEEEVYAVEFVGGLGSVYGDFPFISGVREGTEIHLPAYGTAESAGKHYTLTGWTLREDASAVLPAGGTYRVDAADADGQNIRLYAVWAEDGNRNGVPDREETFTVRFVAGAECEGELPSDVQVGADAKVPLTGSLFRTSEEGHFLAFGWSLSRGKTCLRAPSPEEKIFCDEYPVSASDDADGDGLIVLYAVWGVDCDGGTGDGIPDWEERYTVRYLPGGEVEYAGETLTEAEFIARTLQSDLRQGERFHAPEGGYRTVGGTAYVLLGFTYRAGAHLCAAVEDVLALNGYFSENTVDPVFASKRVIEVYAVWAVDNDRNGTPDFSRTFRVHFANTACGTVSGGMPGDLAVEEGSSVDLSAYALRLSCDGGEYVLLGWAENAPEHPLFACADDLPPLFTAKSGYPVDLSVADGEGKITLYAVWGEDGNRNGVPDWRDDVLVFRDLLCGQVLPDAAYRAGGKTALPVLGAREYAFLGWTADSKLASAPVGSAEGVFTEEFSAAEGANGIIRLYAVWGVCAEIPDQTFGEEPEFAATRAAVSCSFALKTEEEVMYFTANEGFFEALRSIFHKGLHAGNWYLYAGNRLLAHFTVARRELFPTGVEAEERAYDGTVEATLSFSDLSWLNGYRAEIAGYTARFENAEAGEHKKVFVSLRLTGEDAENLTVEEFVVYSAVRKAENGWAREFGQGDFPLAKFGEAHVEYFSDEACTERVPAAAPLRGRSVCYAHVSVEETENWYGIDGVYAVGGEGSSLPVGQLLLAGACVAPFAAAIAICSVRAGMRAHARKKRRKGGENG